MKLKTVCIFLALVLALCVGWYGHNLYSLRDGDNYTKFTRLARERSTHYTFVNPLLFIDNANVTFAELNPLKNKIEKYIAGAKLAHDAQDVSVYFRDLATTRWTGVGEDTLYDPASMQKVVLLIAYLKAAENDPQILDEKLYYSGNTDASSYYKFEHTIEKGKYYWVKDLLVDMITKSGNDSTKALFDNIDKVELAKIYEDLGFTAPEKDKVELISVKVYSRLFRVLYSATYLSSELSDLVLNVLSQTDFNNGLYAGSPKDILVSHKFGERTNTNILEGHQLHDCGIIYYNDNPYFLCVMTKGRDFSKLGKVISDISKITYDYWDSLHRSI